MVKHYKRPIRKWFRPTAFDRFLLRGPIEDGAIVYVTASWGPFRAIETVEQPAVKGTCGRGSLQPVPKWAR